LKDQNKAQITVPTISNITKQFNSMDVFLKQLYSLLMENSIALEKWPHCVLTQFGHSRHCLGHYDLFTPSHPAIAQPIWPPMNLNRASHSFSISVFNF